VEEDSPGVTTFYAIHFLACWFLGCGSGAGDQNSVDRRDKQALTSHRQNILAWLVSVAQKTANFLFTDRPGSRPIGRGLAHFVKGASRCLCAGASGSRLFSASSRPPTNRYETLALEFSAFERPAPRSAVFIAAARSAVDCPWGGFPGVWAGHECAKPADTERFEIYSPAIE
jgi:hypothetical protein